jgi:hypothetical protein
VLLVLFAPVGSLNELDGAIGSKMYAGVLAAFTSDNPPLRHLPGMHFLVAAAALLAAWAVAIRAFATHSVAAETAAVGPADVDTLGSM